ncbi:MAG: hypothetical protein K8S16_03120 [Bacteroidales bacterium]|nr:hypothetical protein [Bacteroidales bacterium]
MKNKEAKRDRFARIAEARVNKILNNLDSLGKCANRRNYEYSDEDVKHIFREIEKKVKDVKQLYHGSGSSNSLFKLKR